jgi:thioesterase domain-containing protein
MRTRTTSILRKVDLTNRQGNQATPTLWQQAYWPGPEYVPPTYGGKVTLVKLPRQPYYRIRDRSMGWGGRARGGVDIHEIRLSEHVDMLREPHVSRLAQLLTSCLRQATLDSSKNGNGPEPPKVVVHAGGLGAAAERAVETTEAEAR